MGAETSYPWHDNRDWHWECLTFLAYMEPLTFRAGLYFFFFFFFLLLALSGKWGSKAVPLLQFIFVRRWFRMWRLFCQYMFLISPYCGPYTYTQNSEQLLQGSPCSLLKSCSLLG